MTEAMLVQHYAGWFQAHLNLNIVDSQRQVIDAIRAIKTKLGFEPSPSENAGTLLLQNAEANEKNKQYLMLMRSEGVTDDNIIYWWNKTDLERLLIDHLEEIMKLGIYADQMEKGLDAKQAALYVRKIMVIYGRPIDNANLFGDDRPIPYELYDRIRKHVDKRVKKDNVKFCEEINKSSTYNSYVRMKVMSNEL